MLIGGNVSAEGPVGTESTAVTGVDIVLNPHLQETSFKKYTEDYVKSIKGNLKNRGQKE